MEIENGYKIGKALWSDGKSITGKKVRFDAHSDTNAFAVAILNLMRKDRQAAEEMGAEECRRGVELDDGFRQSRGEYLIKPEMSEDDLREKCIELYRHFGRRIFGNRIKDDTPPAEYMEIPHGKVHVFPVERTTGYHWIAEVGFHDRDIVKDAGFRWDADGKFWFTDQPEIAEKFRSQVADEHLPILDEQLKSAAPVAELPVAIRHVPDGRWIARVDFDDRHIVKEAGFRWDRDDRVWYTDDAEIAAALLEYCDEGAKAAIADRQEPSLEEEAEEEHDFRPQRDSGSEPGLTM